MQVLDGIEDSLKVASKTHQLQEGQPTINGYLRAVDPKATNPPHQTGTSGPHGMDPSWGGGIPPGSPIRPPAGPSGRGRKPSASPSRGPPGGAGRKRASPSRPPPAKRRLGPDGRVLGPMDRFMSPKKTAPPPDTSATGGASAGGPSAVTYGAPPVPAPDFGAAAVIDLTESLFSPKKPAAAGRVPYASCSGPAGGPAGAAPRAEAISGKGGCGGGAGDGGWRGNCGTDKGAGLRPPGAGQPQPPVVVNSGIFAGADDDDDDDFICW